MERWERQRGENSKNFTHFALYRDLGPGRSLARLAESGKASVGIRRLESCSTRWDWVGRAQAYDDAQEAKRRAGNEAKREEMNERQASLGVILQKAAYATVKKWVDGNGPLRVKLKPFELARVLEVGAKMERLARGEVTDAVEVEGLEQLASALEGLRQRKIAALKGK